MELNWDNAKIWQEKVNENKEESEPKWEWDCGFKLDFDGAIIRVSSRFYPPHKNVKDVWQGSIDVLLLDVVIGTTDIECNSLDELKNEAEKYVKDAIQVIKERCF